MTDAPYERLVALAQVELELVEAGDFAALEPLRRVWRELVETLPAVPPPSAAVPLARAKAINADVNRLLRERADDLRDELGRIEHGRRALNGYAPAAPRHARVDQSG